MIVAKGEKENLSPLCKELFWLARKWSLSSQEFKILFPAKQRNKYKKPWQGIQRGLTRETVLRKDMVMDGPTL